MHQGTLRRHPATVAGITFLLAALPTLSAAWRLSREARMRDQERFQVESSRPLTNLTFASQKSIDTLAHASREAAFNRGELERSPLRVSGLIQWQNSRFMRAVGICETATGRLTLNTPSGGPVARDLADALAASQGLRAALRSPPTANGRLSVWLKSDPALPSQNLVVLFAEWPHPRPYVAVMDLEGLFDSATRHPSYQVKAEPDFRPRDPGADVRLERTETLRVLDQLVSVRFTPLEAFWKDSRSGMPRTLTMYGLASATLLALLAGLLARQRNELNHRVVERTRSLDAANADLRASLAREEEAGRIKTAFLHMVTHELNTPMQLIQTSADLLRRHGSRLPEEEHARLFGRIGSAVERVAGLTQDVAVYAKLETTPAERLEEEVDLATWCRGLIEETCAIRNPPVAMELDLAPVPPTRLELAPLRHALGNLLGNALKYGPPDQPVRLSLRRNGPWAVFEVADRGPGIPEEDRARLFSAFHRGRNVGHLPGTGLGLAIASRSAARLGGDISFRHPPEGGTIAVLRVHAFATPP